MISWSGTLLVTQPKLIRKGLQGSLSNLPHGLSEFGQDARVREHGKARHGPPPLVHHEKSMEGLAPLEVLRVRVRYSGNDFGTEQAVGRLERGEGVAVREDRGAHGREVARGPASDPAAIAGRRGGVTGGEEVQLYGRAVVPPRGASNAAGGGLDGGREVDLPRGGPPQRRGRNVRLDRLNAAEGGGDEECHGDHHGGGTVAIHHGGLRSLVPGRLD